MAANKIVAFLGATGGCTLAALAATIGAGFHARALVRTPQKLKDLLEKRNLSAEKCKDNLAIIEGNAKDPESVSKALCDEHGVLVDQVVFGIGSIPKFSPNPLKPTLQDPGVCQSTMSVVLDALRELSKPSAKGETAIRPLLTAISTTGLSPTRDVPWLMMPLYHWMLAVPHADKREMEQLVQKAKVEGLVRDFVILRPSLLVDGQRQGLQKVRVGWEVEGDSEKNPDRANGPAVGYTISREDVGGFIFDEIISQSGLKYGGKKVSITY